MTNPNEQLAASIGRELLEKSLVTQQDGVRLEKSLAAGTLTAEDWLLYAENSLEADKREQP